MNIFVYTATSQGGNGKPYWFAFEHEATTVDAVHRELVEDGILAVDRISSYDDGEGTRVVTARERVLIGINSIATIAKANMPYREPVAR